MSMGVLRSVQPLYDPLWQFRNRLATGEADKGMTDVVECTRTRWMKLRSSSLCARTRSEEPRPTRAPAGYKNMLSTARIVSRTRSRRTCCLATGGQVTSVPHVY